MKRRTRILAIVLASIVVALAAGAWFVLRQGYSARREPMAVEEWLARRFRHLATPPDAREKRNPVEPEAKVLAGALAHFADHCALCHGNDGSGETEIGAGMYPPPPDLREAATQRMSDGELFYVIRNGIRFTGMPGWGERPDAEDRDSWALVHFIRHLPRLTDAEVGEMERLNPRAPGGPPLGRSRAQIEEAFLEGRDVPAGGHEGH